MISNATWAMGIKLQVTETSDGTYGAMLPDGRLIGALLDLTEQVGFLLFESSSRNSGVREEHNRSIRTVVELLMIHINHNLGSNYELKLTVSPSCLHSYYITYYYILLFVRFARERT